jgi:hypothetical protein
MKKYRFLTGICGATLVFGIWFTGCAEESLLGEGGWTAVKAASEIVGNWEATTAMPIPAQRPTPASSAKTVITISYISGANANFTQQMDFSKYLDDVLAHWITEEAGPKPTKDGLWDSIKPESEGDGTTSGTYWVLMAGLIPTSELMAENSLWINQEKKKLNCFWMRTMWPAISVKPGTEIILTKK